jgi:hypothetical protein
MIRCSNSYIECEEFSNMFCMECPVLKHGYSDIGNYTDPPDDVECPVDFDYTDTKCIRNSLYLEIIENLKKTDILLTEAYRYGNK